jgi:nitrate/nitrite-specific signal transduction histidine kinase
VAHLDWKRLVTNNSGPERQAAGKGRLSDLLKSLRGQLVLRTLVPIGLLVVAFAVFGQIGYTQVAESLAQERDRDLASIEAARVGDHLLESVQALRQVVNSPYLASGTTRQIYLALLDESLLQRFDLTQVSDSEGTIVVASDGTSGGTVLVRDAFDALKDPSLPMIIGEGTMRDGRRALVISAFYTDGAGNFKGVVEGAIALGGQKLGVPLTALSSYEPVAGNSFASDAISYLVASDGTILWHPDTAVVGSKTSVSQLVNASILEPGALVLRVNGEQSVLGYAPLNLGRLIPRARIEAGWVQWTVVTQEKWASIVAPLNSLLVGLVAVAFLLFVISLMLIVRSAGALTRPVGKLVAASQALSTGKLRQRLEIDGPTEIEELSHQFNVMAQRLASSYADLEGKVAERTAELAAANSELERQLVESQTVREVAANIAGTVGLDEILRQIAASAAEALGSESAIVFLPEDGDKSKLCAASIWNLEHLRVGTTIPVEGSLTGIAFTTGQPQVSHSAQQDERLYKEVVGAADVRSMLVVPLISHGHITGALSALNKKEGEFDNNDLRLLRLLADQTAVAIERARLYSDTTRQLGALRTINELALSVTLSQSVEKTMTAGMERIGKLIGTSGSVVYLYDEKDRALHLTASYGLSARHLDMLKSVAPSVAVDTKPDFTIAILEAFQSQQPYMVEETGTDMFMAGWWKNYEAIVPQAAEYHNEISLGALLALPLSVRERHVGTLTIYFAQPRKFDGDEVQMYQSLAHILALAVYNTQLFAQSSKLATVEERARLARELHDSVTQSLFSLNLTLRAARRVLERDPGGAKGLLDDVEELAQGSLAEMRALIFELRPQALENEGLASALEKHADAVHARSGLDVHLNVKGSRRLPVEHEEALYQIAREALHNVVKHAQATNAWVELDVRGEEVVLKVRDDGKGFDKASVGTGGGSHIGTSTMQERSAAIGGQLDITSERGKGTEVRVRVHIPGEPKLDTPDQTGKEGADQLASETESAIV